MTRLEHYIYFLFFYLYMFVLIIYSKIMLYDVAALLSLIANFM